MATGIIIFIATENLIQGEYGGVAMIDETFLMLIVGAVTLIWCGVALLLIVIGGNQNNGDI